jgi:hypothetical protein
MALIILEGLDRTGKSSVARFFENKGFELIHMNAPQKGISNSAYLDEIVQLLMSTSGRDVVLDRSHYGELIWPAVYGRESKLTEEDFDMLREIEEGLDTTRVLMHDPNSDAHWQRCIDNKEPLTKVQFVKARSLYSSMADKYGFDRRTLKDFPGADQPLPVSATKKDSDTTRDNTKADASVVSGKADKDLLSKTKEQLKLDKANAINEVLTKRILKGKGQIYDELERSVRTYLNNELGKIFGTGTVSGFSNEEVELLKFFCERLKSKENE